MQEASEYIDELEQIIKDLKIRLVPYEEMEKNLYERMKEINRREKEEQVEEEKEELPTTDHAIDSMKYAMKAMSNSIDVVKGSNEYKSNLPFSSLRNGRTCSKCDSENVFVSLAYNCMLCDYCGQKYNHK